MATTPAERKALLFLGAVACLGVGVRVVHAVRGERAAVTAAQPALERQLARANVAAREGRERKGAGKAKGRRARGRGDSSGTRGGPAAGAAAASGPVDVDTADSTALAALPGVGPALARRIVEDRGRRGAFGGLAALDGVPGVGPKLLERLAPRVTFSGPPRPPSGEDMPRASRSGRARAPRTPVP